MQQASEVIDNFCEPIRLSVFAILVLVFTAHVQVQLWPSCRASPSAVRDPHAAYISLRPANHITNVIPTTF